ncbi:MAG: hypothetical protein WC861_07280 [Candidatus Micrarchaeia archaeon]|jgi:hypothetical protein
MDNKKQKIPLEGTISAIGVGSIGLAIAAAVIVPPTMILVQTKVRNIVAKNIVAKVETLSARWEKSNKKLMETAGILQETVLRDDKNYLAPYIEPYRKELRAFHDSCRTYTDQAGDKIGVAKKPSSYAFSDHPWHIQRIINENVFGPDIILMPRQRKLALEAAENNLSKAEKIINSQKFNGLVHTIDSTRKAFQDPAKYRMLVQLNKSCQATKVTPKARSVL